MSRMEPLIELCDLIAQNPAQLVEKLAWMCGRCPPAEIQLIGSARVSRSQLNAILAVARFLSKCPNHSDEMPKSLVLAFYRSIPSSLKPPFWPQSITNDSIGSFFRDFLDKVSIDANLLENVRVIVKQQLQLMVAFLKIRKHDWSEQGQSLKVRINLMFAAQQAATRLKIKTLASLDLERKSSKKLLHEALALLMEVAEACLFSVWRKLRACEELFSTLLSGICHVAVVRDGQMLQLLLSWFKHLVLVTCAQADTWGSYRWAMFENVLTTSSEINQFGWDKDHSRLYTFITSLLEKSHFEEEVQRC